MATIGSGFEQVWTVGHIKVFAWLKHKSILFREKSGFIFQDLANITLFLVAAALDQVTIES